MVQKLWIMRFGLRETDASGLWPSGSNVKVSASITKAFAPKRIKIHLQPRAETRVRERKWPPPARRSLPAPGQSEAQRGHRYCAPARIRWKQGCRGRVRNRADAFGRNGRGAGRRGFVRLQNR